MFEFKAPLSEFRNVDDRRIAYGDWKPLYFTYEVIGHHQVLIVADEPRIVIKGYLLTLIAGGRPEGLIIDLKLINGIEVKGLMGLKKPSPAIAYRMHKVLTEEGVRERSGR